MTNTIQDVIDGYRDTWRDTLTPEEVEENIREVLLTFLDDHVAYYALRVPAFDIERAEELLDRLKWDYKKVVLDDGDEFESVEQIR